VDECALSGLLCPGRKTLHDLYDRPLFLALKTSPCTGADGEETKGLRMRHFFTKGTIEASIWCVKCHRDTMHAISNGRPMYCQECQAKPQPKPDAPPPQSTQEEMFK
jgi:DNA-directed RNA polymerase subunit RPC12/RpoP